ncbi:hypothetical protein HYC85_006122 [Camellia sinensis]|uniref:Uncharacterized protein n=1 Tax=Camellia sinensis TaxID=4442 RepID=A0A7J7I2M5_CAMSI|nr:hypothetical protein HYC85_006122 [Camellia sinensis]
MIRFIELTIRHHLKYTNTAPPQRFKQWYSQRLLNIATDSTIALWILFASVILHIWSRLMLLIAKHTAKEAKMFLTHSIYIKFIIQRYHPIPTKFFIDLIKAKRLVSSCK